MNDLTANLADTLDGFKVYYRIGRGTFSEVFKAKHRKTGVKVALKIIKVKEGGQRINHLKQILREIKIMR